MANTHIESLRCLILKLLHEQINHLKDQKVAFLSGQVSTGKYALLDILDGLDGSAFALECLASDIANLEGPDLNYGELIYKIQREFCFAEPMFDDDETWNVFTRTQEQTKSLRSNKVALLFLTHLSNLMYNILIDVECHIQKDIRKFEPSKIGLAIIVHSDTQSCINFLIDELAKRKDGGKREFLRELEKELNDQKLDFFRVEEELLLEHLKFYKCNPASKDAQYNLEHVNYRTIESWITDRQRGLSPKLKLKQNKTELKQRLTKFLTSKEFMDKPIIAIPQDHPADNIFDSISFSKNQYSINHPDLLLATISWLHQRKLIIGITEAKDWLNNIGLIGKARMNFCCETTCWKWLKRNPARSRKVLAKWDVDLSALFAVEDKRTMPEPSISAPISSFSKKCAVVGN